MPRNQPAQYLAQLLKKAVLQDDTKLLAALKAFQEDYYSGLQPPLAARRALYRLGVISVCIDLVQTTRSDGVIEHAWIILRDGMSLGNMDDASELETVDAGVALGIVELALKELSRKPLREACCRNAVTIATAASQEKHVSTFMDNGFIGVMESILSDQKAPFQTKKEMLAVARVLAFHAAAQPAFRASKIAKLADPFIIKLGNPNNTENEAKAALSAGSIIARVYGRDEEGYGKDFVTYTPILEETVRFLNLVLDAGPEGHVYGTKYNPSYIVFDLLTISVADVNKPRFEPFIGTIEKAIRVRGESNQAMLSYAIELLHQLSFEPVCLKVMDAAYLVTVCKKVMVAPTRFNNDENTKISASHLVSLLEATLASAAGNNNNNAPTASGLGANQQQQPQSLGAASPAPGSPAPPPLSTSGRRPSFMQLLSAGGMKASSRRLPTESLGNSASASAPNSAASVVSNPQAFVAPAPQHVMISYNQKASKPVVEELEAMLREAGVETWVDWKNMSVNISDSMSAAVENASVVLVVVSKGYKESGNCRKECEYSDFLGVPMVFLMSEQNYSPTGWLALTMGKSLWVDISTSALVRANFSTVMKRIAESSRGPIALQTNTVQNASSGNGAVKAGGRRSIVGATNLNGNDATTSSSSPSKNAAGGTDAATLQAVLEMMRTMSDKISELKDDVGELKKVTLKS